MKKWFDLLILKRSISKGIYYYEDKDNIRKKIDDSGVTERVKIGEYIIGVREDGLLLPIYDEEDRRVIETHYDDKNYRLKDEEARHIPYHEKFTYLRDIIESISRRILLWNTPYFG